MKPLTHHVINYWSVSNRQIIHFAASESPRLRHIIKGVMSHWYCCLSASSSNYSKCATLMHWRQNDELFCSTATFQSITAWFNRCNTLNIKSWYEKKEKTKRHAKQDFCLRHERMMRLTLWALNKPNLTSEKLGMYRADRYIRLMVSQRSQQISSLLRCWTELSQWTSRVLLVQMGSRRWSAEQDSFTWAQRNPNLQLQNGESIK